MINRVIASRYRIIERIGIGGMAEVYKAKDEVLGRIDAVKVLLPQFASDPTFAARFRQEAQAAANLSSPYIVNIYDWGLDGETYYIVMEYVRGVDLKTAIAQRGAIDQRKVAQIASQVCSGLSVAHGYDVIHRDIKPQNIMIQPDGNIKIMDFGVARAGNSTMTQTGSVLGTANYVSPEQAQGKIPTAASDLYSLGILMYEAVTGRLPFEGPDAISVALKQVNEEPVPPSVHMPNLDPNLEAIILKAMAKNPDERFLSADEMRAALNNYLNGKPTQLLPVAGAAAVTTQVIPSGTPRVVPATTDTTSVLRPNTNGPHPAGEGKGKGGLSGKKKALIAVIVVALIAAIGAAVFMMTSNSASHVPDLVGKVQQDAEQLIRDAGFVPEVSKEYSDDIVAGVVLSQDPAKDSDLARGSTVKIVVSDGVKPPNKVSVPDLANMTPEQVQAALATANLTMKTGDSVFDDKVEVGHVAKQEPAAGSSVDEGSSVTIYLSKGASGVSVPHIVGDDEWTARNTANNYGFVPSVTYEYSEDVKADHVISQSPEGGSMAEEGTTLSFVVSLGPENNTVKTPDFTGMTLSEAKAAIAAAGLTFGGSFGDDTPSATVYDQSPAVNEEVEKNTPVYIDLYASEESSSSSSSSGGGGGNS